MSVQSFFRCASGGDTVVVWPTITDEAGFYDTVSVSGGDESTARTIARLTAYEAASIVMTGLGVPVASTIESVEGMIRRWRAELDADVREPVR